MGKYLTPQEYKELKVLSNKDGWSIVIRLIEKIDLEALNALAAFSTGEQAFERRGEVTGIRRVLDEFRKITALNITTPYLRVEEEDERASTRRPGSEY